MKPDRFTIKTQEAVSAAISLAASRNNPQVVSAHLLAALLDQDETAVRPVLGKLGAQVQGVRADTQTEIDKLGTLSTAAEPTTSGEIQTVLRGAESEMSALHDEYISVEHLLLALTQVQDPAGEVLRRQGITHQAVLKALEDVRGPHRVTDDSPEEK